MSRHRQSSGSNRSVRLSEQIQKDLAQMIQRELTIAEVGLVTLSGVELTPDYAHAKIYFTVLGADPSIAEKALSAKAGWFHSLLFKQLPIHTVPTLKFIYDTRMSEGLALNELIQKANEPGVRADDVPHGVHAKHHVNDPDESNETKD